MVWHDRRVLVTGGCGFIGSHLVEALVDRGACVSIVDDLRSGTLASIQTVAHCVKVEKLAVGDQVFQRFFDENEFDVIYHLASNSYVPPSIKDPLADFQNTLAVTLVLLDKIRTSGRQPKLIYASSAAVYGNPARLPIVETDRLLPISPYGVSKLAAERYMYVYSLLYDMRVASLRFFSVYGPRQMKQVVYDFIRNVSQHPSELCILGDGQQVRDFAYVKDVVSALLAVAENAPLKGEVYNVASGSSCTIEELARTVIDELGTPTRLVFDASVKAGRPGDPEKWIPDISGLQRIGYTPQFSLREGVKQTIEWFRSDCRRDRSLWNESRSETSEICP